MRLAELAARKPTRFDISPEPARLGVIAQWAGIRDLSAIRLAGALSPTGRRDWHLRANFDARVVQDCVISLAPVTSELREEVIRRYLADMKEPTAEEMEMPEDDSAEPLPAVVDLGAVALEVLELALPRYPRAEGASMDAETAIPPGAAPIRAEVTKPFANLRALMERHKDDSGNET